MRVISQQNRKSNQAFTLIEMIGVLAVIAILASMLVPKIFEAINSARINNTVQSYNAIKTAVMDHYGKYGAINFRGVPAPGAPATAPQLANYDTGVLLPEAIPPVSPTVGSAMGASLTNAPPGCKPRVFDRDLHRERSPAALERDMERLRRLEHLDGAQDLVDARHR